LLRENVSLNGPSDGGRQYTSATVFTTHRGGPRRDVPRGLEPPSSYPARSAADRDAVAQVPLTGLYPSVYGPHTLTKPDMVRNDTLAKIEVEPQTFAVKVNAQHATARTTEKMALNQLSFLS
jgi:hypothetical protein